MVRIDYVYAWGFGMCSRAREKSVTKKNCLINLDMTGRIGRMSVGQCQAVGNQVVLLCVRNERDSINRRLKGAPGRPRRGEKDEKRCAEKKKEKRSRDRGGKGFFCEVDG